MAKLNKILAPTDMSELSRTGIRYAMELAEAQRAEVIVYHVIGYEEATSYYGTFDEAAPATVDFRPVHEIIEERRRELGKFLRGNFADLIPKLKVRAEVEVGLPYKRIVEKAVEEGMDMIVMSTHGRTGLLHLLIGSVTEKVVRLARCPVLSVRPMKEPRLAQVVTG